MACDSSKSACDRVPLLWVPCHTLGCILRPTGMILIVVVQCTAMLEYKWKRY